MTATVEAVDMMTALSRFLVPDTELQSALLRRNPTDAHPRPKGKRPCRKEEIVSLEGDRVAIQ